MNIEDLTIKEVIEISSIFQSTTNSKTSFLNDYIGKYVIVRTRNEGINCGEVVRIDETGLVLKDARRIYYHKPKDTKTSWYEGVSVSGLHNDSKISCPVDEKVIIEDYSLTLCSSIAIESLKTHVSHEQH